MQDFNFETDPHFNSFIALINSVRKNDAESAQLFIEDVAKMEKSYDAFGVVLLNTPANVNVELVGQLADAALSATENYKRFDIVNYLVSRAGVRFAEQNNLEALQVYVPKLKAFKELNKREMEDEVYMEVAVEKKYPELLRFSVADQIANNNFGGLGLVQAVLLARKFDDRWAIDELKAVSEEQNFPAQWWNMAALALREEGAVEWADDITQTYKDRDDFTSVTTGNSSDVKTMVSNYRIKQELVKMQDEARNQPQGPAA